MWLSMYSRRSFGLRSTGMSSESVFRFSSLFRWLFIARRSLCIIRTRQTTKARKNVQPKMAARKNAHPKKVDINVFIVLYKSVNERNVQWLSFPSPRSSAPEPVRYVERSGDMRLTEYGPLAFGISVVYANGRHGMNGKDVLSTKNAKSTKNFVRFVLSSLSLTKDFCVFCAFCSSEKPPSFPIFAILERNGKEREVCLKFDFRVIQPRLAYIVDKSLSVNLAARCATRLLLAACAGNRRSVRCSSVAYTLERAVLCEGSVELP